MGEAVEPKIGMPTTKDTTIENQKMIDQPLISSSITQEDKLGSEVEGDLFLHPRREDKPMMVVVLVEEVDSIQANL
jgi:hypothetical protein